MARKRTATPATIPAPTTPTTRRPAFDFTPRQRPAPGTVDAHPAPGPGFTLGRGAESTSEAVFAVLGIALSLLIPLVGGVYYVALHYRLVPYP